MGLFRFHSLFGRTLATIALVSVGFQLLTLSVLAFYVLVPLGKRATDDLAAVMVHAMQRWERLPEQERPAFRKILKQNHDLTLVVTDTPLPDNTDFLPYFYFLRQALARRVGDEVRLKTSRDAKGNEWIWAEIPDYSQKLRLGFLRSRIGIQPPLALLLLFCAGTVLTFFTAALLARRLTIPLERVSHSARMIGKGSWPEPVREEGPEELQVLTQTFNRMSQQVKELLANRTLLLAGISHDLRTPLTQVQLALEMLPDEGGDAELMAGIKRDLATINRLISETMQISLELEKQEQEQVQTDITNVLDGIIQAARSGGKEIEWVGNGSCMRKLNPLALRRVVTNLLENAIRYGDAKPVKVELECDDSLLTIRIQDQGSGIPADQRESVFRPFYRLEKSRSTTTGGSGLGLAIVRQLADANDWEVNLQPAFRTGTVALITIPRME
jgi:two-component system osmolarity sensor histidine kinase EnvZ